VSVVGIAKDFDMGLVMLQRNLKGTHFAVRLHNLDN
jgi:hypothetical protein